MLRPYWNFESERNRFGKRIDKTPEGKVAFAKSAPFEKRFFEIAAALSRHGYIAKLHMPESTRRYRGEILDCRSAAEEMHGVEQQPEVFMSDSGQCGAGEIQAADHACANFGGDGQAILCACLGKSAELVESAGKILVQTDSAYDRGSHLGRSLQVGRIGIDGKARCNGKTFHQADFEAKLSHLSCETVPECGVISQAFGPMRIKAVRRTAEIQRYEIAFEPRGKLRVIQHRHAEHAEVFQPQTVPTALRKHFR